jgi:hypothetical protein
MYFALEWGPKFVSRPEQLHLSHTLTRFYTGRIIWFHKMYIYNVFINGEYESILKLLILMKESFFIMMMKMKLRTSVARSNSWNPFG